MNTGKEKARSESTGKPRSLEGTSKPKEGLRKPKDLTEEVDPIESKPKRKYRDFSKVRCANCGLMGHTFRICKQEKNQETIDRNLAKYKDSWFARQTSMELDEDEEFTIWAQERYAEEIDSTVESVEDDFKAPGDLRQAQLRISTTVTITP